MDGSCVGWRSHRTYGGGSFLVPSPMESRWKVHSVPLARNGSKEQVWLLNRLGGEAERLTYTPQDVDEFTWSPDGSRLALLLRDASLEEKEAFKDQDERDKDSDAGKDDKERKAKTQRPWVIDRRQFKQDEIGYLDRRRTHLYVFDLVKRSLTQITSGDYDDGELAWSPDGKQLAFSSNRSTPDPDATYNTDIWIVSADNTDKGAHVTQVTTSPGEDRSPAWSPDGKWIAYSARLDPSEFEYGTRHLAIISVDGGDGKILAKSFDRMSTQPHFSPDGQFIYFIADDDGTQNLCRIPVAGGEITRPIGGRLMVNDYNVAKTGEIAAQVATIDRPDEIFTIPGGKLTQVTHINDALFSQLKLSHGEYVHFKSKDGTVVAGYLYKPLDYVPGKRVPTICDLMAARCGAYYAEFAHLAQLLAANGYAVLFPNRAVRPGMARNRRKLSSPTGATRISRMTWPWWITPWNRELRTRRNWASVAGRTEAYPRISSLPRRPGLRPPSLALENFCT